MSADSESPVQLLSREAPVLGVFAFRRLNLTLDAYAIAGTASRPSHFHASWKRGVRQHRSRQLGLLHVCRRRSTPHSAQPVPPPDHARPLMT
jgi:hypothetical protein